MIPAVEIPQLKKDSETDCYGSELSLAVAAAAAAFARDGWNGRTVRHGRPASEAVKRSDILQTVMPSCWVNGWISRLFIGTSVPGDVPFGDRS